MSEDTNISKEELEANARAAFDEQTANLNAEDIDDDQVKLAMLQVGVPFSSVTRLFNQFMIDAGFALSREERDEMIERIVGGADDIESEEGFNDVVNQLVDEGNGVITERMAGAMVRGYAKKNDLTVYRKQPGGGGGGGGGFRNAFFDMLRANPRMTVEEFDQILATHEKASDNVRNNRGHYNAIRELVNAVS
jgi:hypothetical protein